MMLSVFLASSAVLARAEPADVCVSVFEEAEQQQAPIENALSGRGVIGAGRLYFNTAPDKRCPLKNVFVIPGDRLEAFANYGEFTSVIYWNAASGAGTAGWVLSERLAHTGMPIVSAASH
jgi:hypothetical protein